jgi:hypothetical protein
MQARRRGKTALKSNGEARLQKLWGELDTDREYLTADKKSLKIISTGTLNNEAGPDFLNAKIKIGDRIYKGDIEVHIKTSDWRAHSHHTNPAYQNVILHAVEKDDSNGTTPAIPIFLFSDAIRQTTPKEIHCPLFANTPSIEATGKTLKDAGLIRFRNNTNSIAHEMLKNGVEKTFSKQIFKAAGFKKNSNNFIELFERFSNYDIKELKKSNTLDAVLWGESCLLPEASLTDSPKEISEFLEEIWRKWWMIRKSASPGINWKRSGSRPLNTPERRLAGLCLLMKKTDCAPLNFFNRLLKKTKHPEKLWPLLNETLICTDKLWDNYSNFFAKRKNPAIVLGQSRALELAVNAILPGLAAYAKLEKNPEQESFIEKSWLLLPPSEENKLVKTALKMWFQDIAPCKKKILNSSAKLQGVMHIYKTFCMKNSQDCKACPVFNSAGLQ